MEFTHLPLIDWTLGLKLAGNQRDLAEDMLAMLLKDLNTSRISIKEKHKIQDYKKMQQEIHKLRGAVSYCGLPRLKSTLEHLETKLKTHIMDDLPSLLDLLDTEINLLLEHHSPFSN
jgi:HPt (histidine-containing phosphotransfer) domain-containing protein